MSARREPFAGRASRRAARLVCIALFVLGAVLRFAWARVPDRSPDEQLYAGFGRGIVQEGLGWFPHMVSEYTNDGAVEYPWVHRAGFLSTVALFQMITGRPDAWAGEILSVVASIATLALAGALAAWLFEPWTAALTLLFMAVSPLDLGIARRAWQDTFIAFLTLAVIALVLRSLSAAKPWRWRLAFWLLATFTLMVKESALIPVGLCSLAIAWDAWRHQQRVWAPLVALVGSALMLTAIGGMLLALCGGLENARELIRLTPEAWKADDYIRHYQTGGPMYYVTGLLKLQPLPWLLAAAAALLALARPGTLVTREPRAPSALTTRLLAGYVAIFMAVSCVYASKNMRFLSPVYAPVAMLAAALVMSALRTLARRIQSGGMLARVAMAAALFALVLCAVADARRFEHYFIKGQIQDLATPWFIKADAPEH